MTRQFAKTAPAPQKLIAQIHIAKAQLKLDEADYRALLKDTTGKASSKDMTPAELGKVIEALVKLGFKPASKGAPDGKKSPRANVRLIFGLWTELGTRGLIENASRPALFAFVEKMTRPKDGPAGSGISHPDWLDNGQANKVVEALKAIRQRGPKKEG